MTPLYSIVIPTYNRPRALRRCLQALAGLCTPREQWEVVVVDDGSPIPIAPLCAEFAERIPVRALRQENSGPARARNAGARAANGRWLCFTDDDCAPSPDWLEGFGRRFATHPGALVGGRALNGLRAVAGSGTSQLLLDFLFEHWRDERDVFFFPSNNLGLARADFESLGGFDTSFPLAAGEDRDLCERFAARGGELVFAPEITIAHFHRLTARKLWRQHFNYGRGAHHLSRARSERGASTRPPEPSFYWKLLRFPWGEVRREQSSHGPVVLSALLLMTQVATISGFLWETRQGEKA